MVYEFEAKTEKEAIDKAIEELSLEKDQFDVEIVDIQKGSLFKKGLAKIKVHVNDGTDYGIANKKANNSADKKRFDKSNETPVTEGVVNDVADFLSGIITRMGHEAEIRVSSNTESQVLYRLIGEASPYLIGKKGKNLDALQLLGNIYMAKLGYPITRVIVDCENYRIRREESLVRLAYDVADKVSESGKSVLLEPMNPYERRLIHTTLSDINYIETKSEGDGLYKQVRVIYKRR